MKCFFICVLYWYFLSVILTTIANDLWTARDLLYLVFERWKDCVGTYHKCCNESNNRKKWMDDLILYNISIMAGPFQDGNHKATKEFTVHTCLDSKHNIDLVVSSVA